MSDLDPQIVATRLALMRDLVADLVVMGPATGSQLRDDRMRRHATERVLGQIVELAASVNSHVGAAMLGRGPASYRDSFVDLARCGAIGAELANRLAPSAGLRNVLVHEYVEIDLDVVAAAIPRAIADYTAYIESVATWLLDRESP